MTLIRFEAKEHKRYYISVYQNLLVPVPKPDEQQKIADCLSSLDDLITAENQKLELLKTHKKGLMQNLFPADGETVPKLRFKEFENSDEWKDKTLGSICSSIASGKDASSEDGKFVLYGSTGIIGKTNSKTYDGSYILVARVGANAGLLTKASGSFGVTDNTLVIQLLNPEKLDFIYYLLEQVNLNKLVFGSGQPLITGSQLKSLSIYEPEPQEQQKVADCLSSLNEQIKTQNQKIETLKLHKKGLMQNLFPNFNGVDL
jgi:type I restriction enzyme S subunit